MSNNKGKTKRTKPAVEKVEEQVIEKETIIIEPEILKVEAPEVKEEVTPENEAEIFAENIVVPETLKNKWEELEVLADLTAQTNPEATKLFESEPVQVINEELGEEIEPLGEQLPEEPIVSESILKEVDEYMNAEKTPDHYQIESHVEGEKLAEALESNHNVDAVAEIKNMVGYCAPDNTCAGQNADGSPYSWVNPEQEEDAAKIIADMVNNQIMEELKEFNKLSDVNPEEVKKPKTLDELSSIELRYFKRTGQMPK